MRKNKVMKNGGLDNNKILLGISGGVDSTVAALLMLEKGFDVYGLYFDITGTGNMRDSARDSLKEAYERCNKTFVPEEKFIYIDAKDDFEGVVIKDFCEAYSKGRTPNPCICCNPNIKFKYLIREANRIGAYHIGTGHYASTYYDLDSGIWYIKKSPSIKDQSYMLCRLGQEEISRLIFPLELIERKETTRQIASEAGFLNADLKDSLELCFVQNDQNYIDFLKERVESPSGNFIDAEGNVLAQHSGIINYTIGKRKGLGVTFGKPMFVTAINAEDNTVTLGSNDDLFTDTVTASAAYFPGALNRAEPTQIGAGNRIPEELRGICLQVKLRYTVNPAEAVITQLEDGRIMAKFKEKQRAATPGQSLVIYKDEIIVGCGFID
ncbi:MAG: tRNA 2-thiouridine(34) synthase MnmA [Eubacteriales bacterium]|nr:tRNA 2-thiouridine(34) synthase MnmA [Eubacteriales bacterium]MDD4390182.1 tRNA 2-thiouridine(34) synthase MnmA [Eubacteriales bacterium]